LTMPTHCVLSSAEYCDQLFVTASCAVRSSSKHAFSSRPAVRAKRTAASQLGPTSNLGGPAATANPICIPIDSPMNIILAAEVIIGILVCDGPGEPIDKSYMASAGCRRRLRIAPLWPVLRRILLCAVFKRWAAPKGVGARVPNSSSTGRVSASNVFAAGVHT